MQQLARPGRYRRSFGFLAMITALVMVVAACGAGGDSGSDDTADEPSSTTADTGSDTTGATDTDPSGSISLMAWGSEEDIASIQAIVAAYTSEYADVEVEFLTGDCAVDLSVCRQLAAANDMPDVVVPHNSVVNIEAELGLIENLDPYIEQDNVDLGSFVPASVSGVTAADGSVYALPMGYHIEVMYYNKALFDEAGLGYPPADGSYTYEDVREWARALTKDSAGKSPEAAEFNPEDVVQWGLYNWPLSLNGYDPILLANGGSVTALDGSATCTVDSPEAVRTFEFIQDLFWEDYSAVTPSADQELAGKFRFADGQIGMLMGAHWMTPIIQNQAPDLEYGVSALPEGDAGNASIVNVHSWAISGQSENKDLAWHFVKWASVDNPMPAMGLIPANANVLEEQFLSLPDEPEHLQEAFIDPASWELTVSPPEFAHNFLQLQSQDGLGPVMEQIYHNTAPAAEALDGVCETLQPIIEGQ